MCVLAAEFETNGNPCSNYHFNREVTVHTLHLYVSVHFLNVDVQSSYHLFNFTVGRPIALKGLREQSGSVV